MINVELLLHGVVLLSGVLGALGAGYLLYADTVVVHYTSFFQIVAVGLGLFAVTAPIIVYVAPASIHAVHGLSALFISFGLYAIISEKFETDADFEALRSDVAVDDE